jgi:hypothetical protein
VLVQEVLDLAREDVLAARDDHLVVAPVDEQAPAGVEVPDVARRQQAAEVLLAAAAGVALEGHLVADEDPAGLALGDLVALFVEELDDRPARRAPGGARGGA